MELTNKKMMLKILSIDFNDVQVEKLNEVLKNQIETENLDSINQVSIIKLESNPDEYKRALKKGFFDVVISKSNRTLNIENSNTIIKTLASESNTPYLYLNYKTLTVTSDVSKDQIKLIHQLLSEMNFLKREKSYFSRIGRYESFFNNSVEGIILLKEDVFVDCNQTAAKMYNLEKQELIGKKPYELSPEQQLDGSNSEKAAKEVIKKALEGEDQIFQWLHKDSNGKLFIAEVSLSRIKYRAEYYLYAIVRNITKRIEIEQRLRSILDNVPAMVSLKNIDGEYLFINKEFEEIFQISREKVVGKTDFDLFLDETAIEIRKNDLLVIEQKDLLEFEEVYPLEDGIHTYLVQKFPLHDTLGELYAVCSLSTDITERKKIHALIEEEKENYKKFLENLTVGVARVNEEEIFNFVNKAACDIFGCKAKELLGKSLLKFVTPKSFKKIRKQTEIRKTNQSSTYEIEIIRPDGEHRVLEVKGVPIIDESDGSYIGSFGYMKDITDIKILQEKYQSLEQIINTLSVIIMKFTYTSDNIRRISYISNNIMQYGYDPQEFETGKIKYHDIIYHEDQKKINPTGFTFNGNDLKEQIINYRILTTTGEIRQIQERIKIVKRKNGESATFQSVLLDNTSLSEN